MFMPVIMLLMDERWICWIGWMFVTDDVFYHDNGLQL